MGYNDITTSPVENFSCKRIRATNRTGSALVKGSCVVIDEGQLQAESTTVANAMANVTLASTANVAITCAPCVVVSEGPLADNVEGWFLYSDEGGICDALIDGGSADLVVAADAQSLLTLLLATTYFTVAASGKRYFAKALEGYTSAYSSSTNATVKVRLYSEGKTPAAHT